MIQGIIEVNYGMAGDMPRDLKKHMRDEKAEEMKKMIEKIDINDDKIRDIAKKRIQEDKHYYNKNK